MMDEGYAALLLVALKDKKLLVKHPNFKCFQPAILNNLMKTQEPYI